MKRTFTSFGAIMSSSAQIVLFFGAVTAVTLLYLSYRQADFLQSFIVIGMILTVPWLAVSLLPTILVLKDRELRKELLWSQVIIMLIAFGILYGISVAIDFDGVIHERVKHLLVSGYGYVANLLSRLSNLILKTLALIVSFCRETVFPFFSGLFGSS